VSNQYTGLEGFTDDELVSEVYRTHDALIHRPIELELAQRFKAAQGEIEALEKFETLTLSFDEMELLKDHLLTNTEQTVGLLKILAEFELDGDDADYLRAALQAAKIINEAA